MYEEFPVKCAMLSFHVDVLSVFHIDWPVVYHDNRFVKLFSVVQWYLCEECPLSATTYWRGRNQPYVSNSGPKCVGRGLNWPNRDKNSRTIVIGYHCSRYTMRIVSKKTASQMHMSEPILEMPICNDCFKLFFFRWQRHAVSLSWHELCVERVMPLQGCF